MLLGESLSSTAHTHEGDREMYKITYNNLYVFFVHMYTVNPTFNQQALLRYNWHTTQCYIAMDQLHVRPKKINYSRLHMTSYPNYYWLAPLGLLPLISMGKYIKIDSFEAKCTLKMQALCLRSTAGATRY